MKTKMILLAAMISIALGLKASAATGANDRLLAAIALVESRGNDLAFGDRRLSDKAYGCFQIRKPCVDDVNKRYHTHIRAEDCLGNHSLSVWVCQKYLEMYATRERLGREPTMEDMARIWNGGPNGWKAKATIAYWSKVRKALA